MIDRPEFERRLFVWLDGELPPSEAAEMEAYCAANPGARARADAERAFDARVKKALFADAQGREVVLAALAKAQATGVGAGLANAGSGGGGGAARRRLFALPRWATGVAAAAVLCALVMWVNCIPPFECGYIQAMEAASVAPATGAAEWDGQPGESVPISLTGCCQIWRSHVPVAGGDAVLLFCPAAGHEPSFRRLRRIGGERWWVGFEDGRTLVAFSDPGERGLWCFVGTEDETTLLDAARKFREERVRASK